MAGSQSFGKRENEKKKQAKRLEKQKRKEERQAAGTSSFDDMIAYVDENGNFTNIPPEERKKETVKLEDIAIATPKKDEMEPEILKGRVEHFNEDTDSLKIWYRPRNIFSTFRPHPQVLRKAIPSLLKRKRAHGA